MTDNQKSSDNFAEDMAEYLPRFLYETEEQLEELVETLLILESDFNNWEALNESFRLIHSIKGSAGIMGFDNITVLTHHLENRFEQFRSGQARLDESTMNLVLRCIDFLRECVNRLRGGQQLGSSGELLAEVKDLERQPEPVVSEQSNAPVEDPTTSETQSGASTGLSESEGDLPIDESWTRLIVHFRGGLQLVDLKAHLIVNRLGSLGTVKMTRPEIENADEFEDLVSFEIVLETEADHSDLRAATEVDGVESIEFADGPGQSAGRETTPRQQKSVQESPLPARDSVDDEAVSLPALGTAVAAGKTETPTKVETKSPAEPDQDVTPVADGRLENTVGKKSESVRVEVDRLDNLMNLAGELVVNRARFEQISAEVNPELRKSHMLNRIREFSDNLRLTIAGMENTGTAVTDWSKQIQHLRGGLELLEEQTEIWNDGRDYVNQIGEAVDQLSRVSHGLRRGVLGTRMVSVAPLFNRFKRVVRDLSKERGKQVNLEIQGEKTELDKRMIDELGDPLVHLVRNSIDHGLETSEERIRLGKPETGSIFLEASHRGNNIYILVRDDGRGINVEKIKSKLVEKQILESSATEELTREQALEYIWHPGFSTADRVTDVSGRGVGMDVVKQRLDSLNGTIHIASVPGQGTTFTIRLPLTLAIISSLLVRVRSTTFSLPIDDVREIVSVDARDIVNVLGKQTFDVRGELIPLRSVDEVFHWHGIDYRSSSASLAPLDDNNDRELQIVVLTSAGNTIGLRVDELLGSQDLVIKSLSDNFINIRGLSGASILGDGSVCLMLEVGTVIDMVVRSSRPIQPEESNH